MTDLLSTLAEFQSLTEKRELAAFRCVSTVKVALLFFESELFEQTQEQLRRAVAEFDAADQAITAFHKRHATSEKESTSHGNRTAA